jgi:hypothetical protein
VVANESIALFRNLGQDELSALRFITQEHPLGSGHEIFREGDAGNGLYFVKDGLVEISGLVGGNTRRVFSQLGPGEIFGEMAVIEQRPRSATATTLKEDARHRPRPFHPQKNRRGLQAPHRRAPRSRTRRDFLFHHPIGKIIIPP